MNLNEQTSRIKKMMGLSEQREDIHISNPIAKWRENVLSGVDKRIKNIFLCMEKKSGQTLPLKFGKRSEEENAKAGGASHSAHLKGLALDIHFETPQKDLIKKLIGYASECGALGIGVYRDGEDLHIDIDSSKGGRRAWGPSYGPSDIPDWAKEEVQKHLKGEFLKKSESKQQLPISGQIKNPNPLGVKRDDFLASFGFKVKYPVQTNTKQSGNTKKTFDVIFMGGKESVIPFDTQLKSLTDSTGDKKVIPFHSNQLEQIKKAIQQNPNSKVILYSLSCDNASAIASIMKNKSNLYIVEPWAPYGNQSVVDAVKNGVPSRNVVTGPLSIRGKDVLKQLKVTPTNTPTGFEHNNVLSYVGKTLLNI